MQGYNCIMVFDRSKEQLLFCKRIKDPYKGLYNFVGGKIETGEDGFHAAYRELCEETGITKKQIELKHMMDFTYYNQDCYVEVYAGVLKEKVELQQELHPLCWLPLSENFFDVTRFAGEGNIGHMVEQVKEFGMGEARPEIKIPCIGMDGCKGGWITATLTDQWKVEKFSTIEEVIATYPEFDGLLIDIPIGLVGNKEQVRPDAYARSIIRARTSTIFPVPCRQAVYAESVAMSYDENVRVLGKKFTPLTVGIMPKIREVDTFLQENEKFKNVIAESHPEVCFSRLNGKTLLTKKSQEEGILERIVILSRFVPKIDRDEIKKMAKAFRCNEDDILDALCLAVSAREVRNGNGEIIPKEPMKDDTGLFMHMVIPR